MGPLLVHHRRFNFLDGLKHADENLLRTQQLSLFPNLKTVVIDCDWNRFDLCLFLEAIANASQHITYTLKDAGKWIKDAFADSPVTAYSEKGWAASYDDDKWQLIIKHL